MAYPKIQYKKTTAIRSFRWKQMLRNIFHFVNVCAALFFISRSSLFPITVQTFHHFYHRFFIPFFNNTFFVFLFVNALILILYSLSDKKTTASFSREFESRVRVRVKSEFENSCPVFEETVTAATQTMTCCTSTTVTTGTGGNSVSEKKRYRRVQSESFERRVVVAPTQREYKRFNTGMEKRLCYVEQLSKEEFNRAVEDFIAKHKRMQWEEQLRSHRRTESLAIVSHKDIL